MKLIPIASDSIGVRSLSHMVEVFGVHILVDAGAALGPRFGLLPHPMEYRRLGAIKRRIRELAEKAHIIFISHYHYDHYTPAWDCMEWKWTWSGIEEAKKVYSGKLLWAKDPDKLINRSQHIRADLFFKAAKFISRTESFISTKIDFEGVEVEFSTFSHGPNTSPLGFVLSIRVEDEYLYLSDVQGPGTDEALAYALRVEPKYCVLSGPPIYLSGIKVPKEEVDAALSRLFKLTEVVKVLIVDHHLMRSKKSLNILQELKRRAKVYNNEVRTFAEILGIRPDLLEANRKELYKKYPPEKEFLRWAESARRCPPRQPPPL